VEDALEDEPTRKDEAKVCEDDKEEKKRMRSKMGMGFGWVWMGLMGVWMARPAGHSCS
jgi:hypothetical protein